MTCVDLFRKLDKFDDLYWQFITSIDSPAYELIFHKLYQQKISSWGFYLPAAVQSKRFTRADDGNVQLKMFL